MTEAKLLGREPTPEMIEAATPKEWIGHPEAREESKARFFESHRKAAADKWRAMWDAAPQVAGLPEGWVAVPTDAQIAELAVEVGLPYGPETWNALRNFAHGVPLLLAAAHPPAVQEEDEYTRDRRLDVIHDLEQALDSARRSYWGQCKERAALAAKSAKKWHDAAHPPAGQAQEQEKENAK